MATPTAPTAAEPEAPIHGARVLVVEARFHADIADALRAGALARLAQAGVAVDVIQVPGALEIAPAVAIAGAGYDGAVALGCVIRGETLHFEIVAIESARALLDLSVARRLPIGNGILTVDSEAQAWERADPARLDKGGGAASAALALIRLARARGGPS